MAETLSEILTIPKFDEIFSGAQESIKDLPEFLTGLRSNDVVFNTNYKIVQKDTKGWYVDTFFLEDNKWIKTDVVDMCSLYTKIGSSVPYIISFYSSASAKSGEMAGRYWTSLSVAGEPDTLGISSLENVPGVAYNFPIHTTFQQYEENYGGGEEGGIDFDKENGHKVGKNIIPFCKVTDLYKHIVSPKKTISIERVIQYPGSLGNKTEAEMFELGYLDWEPKDPKDKSNSKFVPNEGNANKVYTSKFFTKYGSDFFDEIDCLTASVGLDVNTLLLGLSSSSGDVFWEQDPKTKLWHFVIKKDEGLPGLSSSSGDVYWEKVNGVWKFVIKKDEGLPGLSSSSGDVYWEKVNGVWKFVIKKDKEPTTDLSKSGDVYWNDKEGKFYIGDSNANSWPPPRLEVGKAGVVLWNGAGSGYFTTTSAKELIKSNAATIKEIINKAYIIEALNLPAEGYLYYAAGSIFTITDVNVNVNLKAGKGISIGGNLADGYTISANIKGSGPIKVSNPTSGVITVSADTAECE